MAHLWYVDCTVDFTLPIVFILWSIGLDFWAFNCMMILKVYLRRSWWLIFNVQDEWMALFQHWLLRRINYFVWSSNRGVDCLSHIVKGWNISRFKPNLLSVSRGCLERLVYLGLFTLKIFKFFDIFTKITNTW